MISLIPILILGILILVLSGRLVLQWSRKKHAPAVTIEDFSKARTALDSVFVETAAMKRVLALDDLDFIRRAGTPKLQRFFLKERKALAVQWLQRTQKLVAQLMDLHLKLASYTYYSNPRFEFRLTINYLFFIFASNVLLAFLWVRGPFQAARIVSYTLGAADYFCSVLSLRLEEVDPVKLGPTRAPRMV